MSNNKKWLSFDNTIHAGHIIIVCCMAVSVIGSYIIMQSDIQFLEKENRKREAEIVRESEERKADIARVTDRQNAAFEKLRDDMNRWFMSLSNKLDRKADK